MATISFKRQIVIRNKKGIQALKKAVNTTDIKALETTKNIKSSTEKATTMVKDYFNI